MNGQPSFEHWRHAQELRETWQGRLMRAVPFDVQFGHVKPGNKMAAVVLSVLAQSYEAGMWPLMVVTFEQFTSILPPFFTTCGKISLKGKIYADMTTKSIDAVERVIVFHSEKDMQTEFRKLADKLKLNDDDRRELFGAVKRWIVCDYRIDPNTGEKEKVA